MLLPSEESGTETEEQIMALLVHTWDMPADKRGLEEYRLVGQEAIPIVLQQPGVREFRAYRSPTRASPQVAVHIEFESDTLLQQFLESYVHGELVHDLLRSGIRNFRSEVWGASPVAPDAQRPTTA
jgi:hypothetical protein